MEATDEIAKLLKPEMLTPVAVDIEEGAEYPDELWKLVTESIQLADAIVATARAAKWQADAAYDEALRQRVAVQATRDSMIVTDARSASHVGRLAGIARQRSQQIRQRFGRTQ